MSTQNWHTQPAYDVIKLQYYKTVVYITFMTTLHWNARSVITFWFLYHWKFRVSI